MSPELSFHSLADASDPVFPRIIGIYNDAFPDDQRMTEGRIVNMLKRQAMHITVCASDGDTVGFAAYLRPPGARFSWLEYFAVQRGLRGGGIGSALFRWTAATAAHGAAGMLLEIEPPAVEDERERRVRVARLNFYQRLGCVVLVDFPYLMWTQTGDVPMQLLFYPGEEPGPASAEGRSHLYAQIHDAVAERRRFYQEASAEWRRQQAGAQVEPAQVKG